MIFRMIVFAGILFPALVFSHGVNHRIISGGKGIHIRYADGQPMAFSEVIVRAPGKTKPYLKGVTDRHGRFVFLPDCAGVWTLIVNDGMGHGARVRLKVDRKLEVKTGGAASFLLWQKILIGVSLILGITGLYTYYLVYRGKGDAHT